jgi:hypothetical protein
VIHCKRTPHRVFHFQVPNNFPINHPPKFPPEFTRSFTFQFPDNSRPIYRSFNTDFPFSFCRISRFPVTLKLSVSCRVPHHGERPTQFWYTKIMYLRPLASWRLSDINVLCNVPLHHLLRLPKGATPLENPPIESRRHDPRQDPPQAGENGPSRSG